MDELVGAGVIQSASVKTAFRAVPRHLFLTDVPVEQVYQDSAIPTKRAASERAISSSSQPAIMAIMLQQLDLRPGHRLLEIGAGTGYNAALMVPIVGEEGAVVTLDVDEDIVVAARAHLGSAGHDEAQVYQRDGWEGYTAGAPPFPGLPSTSASSPSRQREA